MRKTIIISSILIILLGIYITKRKNENSLNFTPMEGFEYKLDNSFDMNEETKKGFPILLILGTKTCPPCREMQPTLKLLNKDFQGKVKIIYLDVIKYKEAAKQFNYKLLPTLLFVTKEGKLYTAKENVMSRHEILKIFKEMGYNFDK
ncbi:MAG: thioredoxin family protein [Bacilli bacterium]